MRKIAGFRKDTGNASRAVGKQPLSLKVGAIDGSRTQDTPWKIIAKIKQKAL